MKYSVVILAAGSSIRYDNKIDKILTKINSIPVIDYSLNFFLKYSCFNQIIIVSSLKNFDYLSKTYSSDRVFVTIGGSNRQQSVYKSLAYVNNDYVLIHDAARPIISEEYIAFVISNIVRYEAITIGSKLKDTIHVSSGDSIVDIIDRNSLVKVYTPQAFKTSTILESHKQAVNFSFLGSDDISVVSKFSNITPFIFFSDDMNIKLTTKKDLTILEAILNENW
jgi:2-C-methyl-D-erythritol 4-phosphate cytidylyltransferase